MKYVFKILNNSNVEIKHNSLAYQPVETTQDFLNRSIPKTEYISIVDVMDGNIKIITNAIKNKDYVSSYDIKISELEEIDFKRYYIGNFGLFIFITFLIICVTVAMYVISNNIKSLLLLFFIGALLKLELSNVVEIIKLKIHNKCIFIPIRDYMGYDYDIELKKMEEELHNYNSSVVFKSENHSKNIKKIRTYNMFFIIFICVAIIAFALACFL